MTEDQETLYETASGLATTRIVAEALRTCHSGGDPAVRKELNTAYRAVNRAMLRLEQRVEEWGKETSGEVTQ